MTTIHLVRHAANDAMARGILAGRAAGVHLNDAGRAQAESLADYFAAAKLDAVYTSPLERAMETAQPIALTHKQRVKSRKGLQEIDFGSWQGKSLKALRRRKLWPTVQTRPSLAQFPDGESFSQAQSRVVATIDKLRKIHKQPKSAIVCVSHADTIKLILAHYAAIPLDQFQRLLIGPASISTLWFSENNVMVARINDMSATENKNSS